LEVVGKQRHVNWPYGDGVFFSEPLPLCCYDLTEESVNINVHGSRAINMLGQSAFTSTR